jgi:hypothetical protein
MAVLAKELIGEVCLPRRGQVKIEKRSAQIQKLDAEVN